MKTVTWFAGTSCAVFLTAMLIFLNSKSPEKLIIGKWQEVSWEYDKVNENSSVMFSDDDFQRNEICREMLIHKAEIWEFYNDGTLILSSENHPPEILNWQIKGRGHILVLTHGDNRIESFQIQELSNNHFIIHFSFDLQVRGIVKMTFKKIQDKNA